jgi:hypothetical protein
MLKSKQMNKLIRKKMHIQVHTKATQEKIISIYLPTTNLIVPTTPYIVDVLVGFSETVSPA